MKNLQNQSQAYLHQHTADICFYFSFRLLKKNFVYSMTENINKKYIILEKIAKKKFPLTLSLADAKKLLQL